MSSFGHPLGHKFGDQFGADGGAQYTPRASGAVAWYDPSDLSSMWQDSAGTTPAALGQPVGKIADKSGNGYHATQATAIKRPILRQNGGGFYYLEFDGVDDRLLAAGLTQAQPLVATVAAFIDTPASFSRILDGETTRVMIGWQPTEGGVIAYAGAIAPNHVTTVPVGPGVWTGVFNTPTSAIRYNGAQQGGAGDAGPNALSGLVIGAGPSALGETLEGGIYQLAIIAGIPASFAKLETFMGAKIGLAI